MEVDTAVLAVGVGPEPNWQMVVRVELRLREGAKPRKAREGAARDEWRKLAC